MKFRHIAGALVGACIIGVWGLIFMCICRVKTGQWWMEERHDTNK